MRSRKHSNRKLDTKTNETEENSSQTKSRDLVRLAMEIAMEIAARRGKKISMQSQKPNRLYYLLQAHPTSHILHQKLKSNGQIHCTFHFLSLTAPSLASPTLIPVAPSNG